MSVAAHTPRTTVVGAEQEALSWVPRGLLKGGCWETLDRRRVEFIESAIDSGTSIDCPTELLIGGAFVEAEDGRTLAVEDPASGRAIAEVADASPADCMAALDAAVAAQPTWSTSTPRDRARVLRRAADAVRDQSDQLARILTAEMGRPLSESAAEVEFAADYLEWFADEAVRITGRTQTSPDGQSTHLVVKSPVGPSLIVTPWNFPLAVPARGIGPALAAGCTVVLRPSSLTPLSALALGRILTEAGLPAGVLNIVVSSEDDATDPLLADGRVRKLTFTGSEPVGRHLIRQSADQVLRVSAELGGCAPFLVFDDADIDAAVDGAVSAKMRNGGAACTAANRFYVQRSRYDEFVRRLAQRIGAIRIGPGARSGVGCGPMISARHVDRLADLVDDADARGARVVLAGGAVPGDGYFFAPVVLADVPHDARVMREEIFGPIVAIAPFDTDDEALRLANDHDAGLAAYLYTSDLARAMRVGGAIEAGMVGINRSRVSCVSAPFGGLGHSGFGHSGSAEGIDAYLTTRYLTMPTAGGAA
jgi:succinate-semialdehyde dehydrogenase/glutarate-semialdehyde dehydrogenase